MNCISQKSFEINFNSLLNGLLGFTGIENSKGKHGRGKLKNQLPFSHWVSATKTEVNIT